MKYLDRIYEEASKEFGKPYYRNLPFIEALAIMIIVGRGMAESIEIFPYSVNRLLVSMANRWAYSTAPLIDEIYGRLGYIFSPDVALMHKLPSENPLYPLPVWMISLWSFTICYTLAYWLLFTSVTYLLGRLIGGRGSFIRLLTWLGISHIGMINWWFYAGCEMLYELVEQEIYLNPIPPYTPIKTRIPTPWGALPTFLPVEGFWAGYGMAVASMILTLGLIYGFTKRELKLTPSKTILTIIPWILFLSIVVLAGSMNIDEITAALDRYVRIGKAWRWFP